MILNQNHYQLSVMSEHTEMHTLIEKLDRYFANRELEIKNKNNVDLEQVVLEDDDETEKLIKPKDEKCDISKSVYGKIQRYIFIVSGGLIGSSGFLANIPVGVCFTMIGLGLGVLVSYQ